MVEEREDFLWVEKYRPTTIEDCVLPKDIKQTFLDIIEKNQHSLPCVPLWKNFLATVVSL